MNLKQALLLFVLIPISNVTLAQVTFGSTAAPVEGSLLDLKQDGETTKGLALPRVELKNTNTLQMGGINTDVDDVYKAHTGLLVYNVPEDPSCPLVVEGLHVWDGEDWNYLGTKIEKTTITPHDPGTSTDLYPGANSYVMGHHERINIPIKRAFEIWRTYERQTSPITLAEVNTGKILDLTKVNNLQGTLSASIAWQEGANGEKNGCVIENNVKIEGNDENALLVVESMTRKGNALVQVHIGVNGDSTDPVLWQWHIWIPDGNPTAADALTYHYDSGSEPGGNHFMDRSLGAIDNVERAYDVNDMTTRHAFGLYYQWGRSVPFMRTDVDDTQYPDIRSVSAQEILSTNTDLERASFNLANSIQNAGFINTKNNNDGSSDWYCYTQTESVMLPQWGDRWGNLAAKSAFDPCPVGWRVPSSGGVPNLMHTPWTGVSDATLTWNNGYNFTYGSINLGYWSAASYRIVNRGGHMTAWSGKHGSYWTTGMRTTAFNRKPAIHLYMSHGVGQPSLVTSNMSEPGQGYNVRCVKE